MKFTYTCTPWVVSWNTYIHKLTPFSHGVRQKLQNATCYVPYILLSPRPHSYIVVSWAVRYLTNALAGLVHSNMYGFFFKRPPHRLICTVFKIMSRLKTKLWFLSLFESFCLREEDITLQRRVVLKTHFLWCVKVGIYQILFYKWTWFFMFLVWLVQFYLFNNKTPGSPSK